MLTVEAGTGLHSYAIELESVAQQMCLTLMNALTTSTATIDFELASGHAATLSDSLSRWRAASSLTSGDCLHVPERAQLAHAHHVRRFMQRDAHRHAVDAKAFGQIDRLHALVC